MSKKTNQLKQRSKKSTRRRVPGTVKRGDYPVSKQPSPSSDSTLSPLKSISTNAWRIKKRVAIQLETEDDEHASRLLRHVESIIDGLAQMGVKIIDYPEGSRYDAGMPPDVIAYEPSDNIATETIVQTVKPGVEYKGQLIQPGEVIVGTPMNPLGGESHGPKHG